jgi:GNAT superfamily N-acetyltransferase
MPPPIQIVSERKLQKELSELILNKLIQFNTPILGIPDYEPVVLVVKRDEELIGGLTGYSLYGWMKVEVLWVAEHKRGQGIGRALMSQVEMLARDRCCAGVYLDTFDCQAPGFYEKLNYRVLARLPEFPNGHELRSYFKRIDSAR